MISSLGAEISHSALRIAGYDTSFQLPIKILGRGGADINDRWQPHPVSYLSVAVDGFPNLFMAFGPNSGVGSGSLLALLEYQVMYAVQATAKLQRERLKSIEVKPEAVRDFDQYLEVRWLHAVSQSELSSDTTLSRRTSRRCVRTRFDVCGGADTLADGVQ